MNVIDGISLLNVNLRLYICYFGLLCILTCNDHSGVWMIHWIQFDGLNF